MSLAGGYYRIGFPQIKNLPIAIPTNQALIKNLETKVDEIQKIFSEIDQVVYQSYGLSEEEINYIKNFETEIRRNGADSES